MATNTKTLYDATFIIDGVPVDWNTEVEVTISHDADTVQTDSGNIKYDDKITCSSEASHMGGSQIWLDPTETLSVDEMFLIP